MFNTRMTELLGIKYPIMQGGLQWIARPELVAAVSNAGGLGVLTALSYPSPKELATEIRKTRELTDKPFGVNLTLAPTLHPINYEAYISAILEEGMKIVEVAGGNPQPYMSRFKSAGAKVINKCTAVRFAQTSERIGCDAITIDGFESAGHPGEEDVTSLILTPLTIDAVSIPVIASGGFGDARGFVAALALGAEGVNIGTIILATQESPIHPKVKEWLIQASERDTMLVMRSLRNTMRVLRNSVAEKVVEMERRSATVEELAPLISGEAGKKLIESGELERGLLTAGQVVGLIRNVPTVKELIDSIISGAREIIEGRLNKFAAR